MLAEIVYVLDVAPGITAHASVVFLHFTHATVELDGAFAVSFAPTFGVPVTVSCEIAGGAGVGAGLGGTGVGGGGGGVGSGVIGTFPDVPSTAATVS
jgi:hypothetical protein